MSACDCCARVGVPMLRICDDCAKAEYNNGSALALLPEVERVLDVLKDVEWATKADWLGLCAFRMSLRCQGTNGHNSAMGTPRPKPHAEHCPFNQINALLSKLKELKP